MRAVGARFMADFILMEGDTVLFESTFGVAAVMVQPGALTASGPTTIKGTKICVAGDEGDVAVEGCTYTAGAYATPGMGTLKIARLGDDQTATKTKSGDKAVLLRGSQFDAKFEVKSPAKQPPPAETPGATTIYEGKGSFTTTNTLFQGT